MWNNKISVGLDTETVPVLADLRRAALLLKDVCENTNDQFLDTRNKVVSLPDVRVRCNGGAEAPAKAS